MISNKEDVKLYKVDKNYPYKSSDSRQKKILIIESKDKVKIGGSLIDLLKIVGSPDQTNNTYDKNDRKTIIGYSLVYIIEKNAEFGSYYDKGEKSFIIHFSHDDKIIKIQRDGIKWQ